jgi:hypothetical protein
VFTLFWDQKLQLMMVEMFLLKLATTIYGKISGMISKLQYPFRKNISPKVHILASVVS